MNRPVEITDVAIRPYVQVVPLFGRKLPRSGWLPIENALHCTPRPGELWFPSVLGGAHVLHPYPFLHALGEH
jgi:hypothetical protein